MSSMEIVATRTKFSRVVPIFDNLESIVAENMIREGKLGPKIEVSVPHGRWYNDQGVHALFTISLPPDRVAEFDRRVRNLKGCRT